MLKGVSHLAAIRVHQRIFVDKVLKSRIKKRLIQRGIDEDRAEELTDKISETLFSRLKGKQITETVASP